MKSVRVIGGYVVAVVAAMIVMSAPTHAQEAVKTDAAKPDDKKAYEYVAQPGDSYTQMVRKAVQTYGILQKKDIGNARIVAIETTLSQKAGWPALEVGQKVSFDEKQIADAVTDAMKLSEAEVALWQTYVPFINFNTNRIGE